MRHAHQRGKNEKPRATTPPTPPTTLVARTKEELAMSDTDYKADVDVEELISEQLDNLVRGHGYVPASSTAIRVKHTVYSSIEAIVHGRREVREVKHNLGSHILTQV
jgi:hypothetical protein